MIRLPNKYAPVSSFVAWCNKYLLSSKIILQLRAKDERSIIWKQKDFCGDFINVRDTTVNNILKKNKLSLNKLLKIYDKSRNLPASCTQNKNEAQKAITETSTSKKIICKGEEMHCESKETEKSNEEEKEVETITAEPPAHSQGGSVRGFVVGNEVSIKTPTEDLRANYAIVELDNLIASHNEDNFAANKNYPLNCQQRDYSHDKVEQLKVITNANNYNPDFLINTDPSPANGSPIVDKNFIVHGGNSRTMTAKLVMKNNKFGEYVTHLKNSCLLNCFGFSVEDIDKFKHPFLVRLLQDENSFSCSYLSNILNSNFTQELNYLTESVSLSKQLTPDIISEISLLIDSQETNLKELLDKQFVKIKALLEKANIITKVNINKWIKSDRFTVYGAELLKFSLIALILPEQMLIENLPSYTNILIACILPLLKLKQSKDFDISEELQEVVKLENDRRSKHLTDIDFYISQQSMFKNEIPEQIVSLWRLLSKGLSAFRGFIKKYAAQAENEDNQDSAFFKTEKFTKKKLIERLTKTIALNDEFPTYTLNDISQIRPDPMPLPDVRLRNFLNLQSKFDLLIWGRPGQLKSSFTLRLLDLIAKTYPRENMLYISTEERLSAGTLTMRANLIKANASNLTILTSSNLDFIEKSIKSGLYRTIVIDSVSAVTDFNSVKVFDVRVWKKYMDENPNINFIFVCHATQDKKSARDIKNLDHFVDVVIKADNGVFTTLKNRFAVLGQYKF